MNKEKNISILIVNSDNILTVDSLKQQTFENFECFLINNSIKQIDEYIKDDPKFHISNETDIKQVIEQTNGKYIIITNSDNIFIPCAMEYIDRMANLTNADILNFKIKPLNNQNIPAHKKPNFNYICSKNKIMEHIFDDLSCFCIKKEILFNIKDFSMNHFVVLDALKTAKDMATTMQTYMLQRQVEHTDYKKVVANFVNNEKDFSFTFWKKYFKHFVPKIVNDTIRNNDKNTFVYCCKNIPLRLIPLKYKFIFFMMRITNK